MADARLILVIEGMLIMCFQLVLMLPNLSDHHIARTHQRTGVEGTIHVGPMSPVFGLSFNYGVLSKSTPWTDPQPASVYLFSFPV